MHLPPKEKKEKTCNCLGHPSAAMIKRMLFGFAEWLAPSIVIFDNTTAVRCRTYFTTQTRA